MKHIFTFVSIFILFLFSCNEKKMSYKKVLIESPEMKHSITIITKGNVRYVMNGKHEVIPDDKFAKLDIKNISPIGDEVGICWNIDGYEWRFVNAYALYISSSLDSTRFDFKKQLDEVNGIPTFKNYLYNNCTRINIRDKRVTPSNGAILTYF